MELKPSYRQTEVGVIPEDWKVTTVGQISDVKTGPFGSALHERDYVNDGTPIITVEHLGEYGVLHKNLPMVSHDDKQRLNAYTLQAEDIVFSRVGSIDRNALIKFTEEGWLFSGRLLRVRVIRNYVDAQYLSFHFHSEVFKQLVRNVAVGQTMASINTLILKSVNLVLPPTLTEQQAIATALSDVDALIESLDRLIAKKHDIKQAVMQELLTGKRRLPGFSGEWIECTLFDVADVLKGNGIPKSLTSVSGIFACVLYGELFTKYGRIIEEIESRTNLNEGTFSVAGDVLMPGSTTTTGIDLATASAILLDNVSLGGDINIIRQKTNQYNPVFLANYLTYSKRRQISEITQGITIHHLYGRDLKKLPIKLPPLPEQQAIATILSDMDAEITALEKKRYKTKLIKQGMMQELLTGRIRLVEPEVKA